MKHLRFIFPGVIILSLLFSGFLPAVASSNKWPVPYHGPYLIVSQEDNWKYRPAVAYSTLHDEYMVVWEVVQPNNHHEIQGRRVTPGGQMSYPFLIFSDVYNSFNPQIAYDYKLDRYFVVWSYDSAGDGTDGDIYGRFIPWDGPIDAEAAFGVDIGRANQDKPHVAYSPTSEEYLVIWRQLADYDDPWGIMGGIIYNDKNGFGVTISSGADERDFPDLTYNLMRNQFMVTWDMWVMGDLDIYAIRLDFNGQPEAPEFPVANTTLNEQHPTVAACYSEDKYLFAWEREQEGNPNDYNLWGRMMIGNGALNEPRFVDGTTLPQEFPKLSCNPKGNDFFLVWHDQYAQPYPRWGVWGMVIHPSFTMEPSFEIVRPSNTRDRTFPSVSYGEKSALVVWQHNRESTNYIDIWGQVIWPYTSFIPLVHK
jgi:hypothetical protein